MMLEETRRFTVEGVLAGRDVETPEHAAAVVKAAGSLKLYDLSGKLATKTEFLPDLPPKIDHMRRARDVRAVLYQPTDEGSCELLHPKVHFADFLKGVAHNVSPVIVLGSRSTVGRGHAGAGVTSRSGNGGAA